MKTLLIVLVFTLDPSGKPVNVTPAQGLFADEKTCLEAGAEVRSQLPPGVLSVATCVPESAFSAPLAPGGTPATPPAAGAPATPAPAPAPTPAPDGRK